MNGYKLLIDSYKAALEREDKSIDRDFIHAKIRSLEPFSERTNEEIVRMFDSGAFNDVLLAYCRVAMQNCHLDQEKINEVLEEVRWLLDTTGANEILNR